MITITYTEEERKLLVRAVSHEISDISTGIAGAVSGEGSGKLIRSYHVLQVLRRKLRSDEK